MLIKQANKVCGKTKGN